MLLTSLLGLIIYGSFKKDTLSHNNKLIEEGESNKTTKMINRLGLIVIIYTLIIQILITEIEYITIGINIVNSLLLINSFNNMIILIILLISIFYIILISFNITKIEIIDKLYNSKRSLIIIILFNILGLILLTLVNDIMMLFIVIELQSYSLYLITSIYNESNNSIISGLYYFIIGSIGSFIILDATVSIYDDIGLTNIQYILMYIDKLSILDLLCLLLGLFIKLGLAPFYTYTIIIYTLSPTIITNYISLMPKLSILTLITIIINYINNSSLRNIDNYQYIEYNNNNNNNNSLLINDQIINNIDINLILVIFIIMSILIGSLGGLKAIKIQTLLAYSSLLNISYILITIITNNNESIIAYLFYIIQYSLTHINIFNIILLISIYSNINLPKNSTINSIFNKPSNLIDKKDNKHEKDNNDNIIMLSKYTPIEYISQLKNLINNNIYLTISLCICLFSLIGIPPLSGYYGKLLILISSLNNGYILLSIILIIGSSISTYYYANIIRIITTSSLINEPLQTSQIIRVDEEDKSIINNDGEISNIISYIISTLTLMILLIIIQYDTIIKGAYLVIIYN